MGFWAPAPKIVPWVSGELGSLRFGRPPVKADCPHLKKCCPRGWVPEDGSVIGPPNTLRFGRGHQSWGVTCLRSPTQQSPSWVTQGDQACVQVAPNTYSLETGSPSEVRRLPLLFLLLSPPPGSSFCHIRELIHSLLDPGLPQIHPGPIMQRRENTARVSSKNKMQKTTTMLDTGSSRGPLC